MDALEEYQNSPEKEDKIYKEKLAPLGISLEEWKVFKIVYNTSEKIEKARRMIPKNLEHLKKLSFLSYKEELLYKKLESKITAQVYVSDKEIMDYYKQKYGKSVNPPDFLEVKNDLKRELLEKKKNIKIHQWWQEQFKKAKIEIKDNRFKDVINMLIPPKE